MLNFLVRQDVRSTISMVIVGWAFGIVAGTPQRSWSLSAGRLITEHSSIKGGLYMETLCMVDTIVLYQTGTLAPAIRSHRRTGCGKCGG